MKRLLLLVFMCLLFVSCFSTQAKVRYIGDAYYSDRGYFEIWGSGVGDRKSSISFDFRSINGTDKIVIISEYSSKSIMTVSKTDKVLLRFADGKEIKLSYNNRVSQYEDGWFELRATSGVIEDFGTLEIVRITTDDGYLNFKADKKSIKRLTTRFNMIKAEATAMYGNKENIEE